jgi:hypothetical protein
MLRSLLLCSALLAGCYSEEPDVAYGGGGVAVDGAPGLVEVSPGVQVIADYDYPVFYSDGEYWRYDGGIWYQSAYWGGGWGLAYNVPYGVRGIRDPGAYTHWNGGDARDHRGGYANGGFHGGAIYDHRGGFNGGSRAAPVRSSPGQAGRPMGRGFGGGGGFRGGGGGGIRVGGMRGGGGGFHGGGGGHGGHR